METIELVTIRHVLSVMEVFHNSPSEPFPPSQGSIRVAIEQASGEGCSTSVCDFNESRTLSFLGPKPSRHSLQQRPIRIHNRACYFPASKAAARCCARERFGEGGGPLEYRISLLGFALLLQGVREQQQANVRGLSFRGA